MDDKNLELIHQGLDLLFSNIQNSLSKTPNESSGNIKNKFETEVKKFIRETNTNYHFSSNLPYRGNEKYLKIEKYEDYEFTHCIAYEMATRNNEVIKLTNIAENLNILNYYLYDSLPISEKWKITINILALKKGVIDSSKIPKNSKANNTTLDTFKNFKDELEDEIEKNLTETNINSITESFKDIIDKNGDDYLMYIITKYNLINFQKNITPFEGQNLSTIFHNAIPKKKMNLISLLLDSVELKLEKEYYVVNEQKSITPENIEKFVPKDTNYESNEAITNHIDNVLTESNYKDNVIYEKGYTLYQGAYQKDNSFYINEAIPNFDQPLRMFNAMKISINPSLPLNDILSFVKKIKEDYDKRNSFKSFFELLESDLDISNEIKKSTVYDSSSLSKEKWADMFYIYDYFQFYFAEGNKINKGKTENKKENKENVFTTVAKEISLQLSFYHILKHKKTLDFSEFADIDDYKSAYNKYEMDLFYEIKEKIETNKEYEKYIKSRKGKNGEETVNFYMTADYIKTDYYPKMKKLIEGENPEYKKLIGGRNHEKNSFIDGKNNASSKL